MFYTLAPNYPSALELEALMLLATLAIVNRALSVAIIHTERYTYSVVFGVISIAYRW
jgi:hypothetical protein